MPTFRALTMAEMLDLSDLAGEAYDRVQAAYPEVFALDEAGEKYATPNHPKRARASFQLTLEADIIPPVWLAWQGDDRPKTPGDLMTLDYPVVMEYARAVRAVNPTLTLLPEPRGNADAPVA